MSLSKKYLHIRDLLNFCELVGKFDAAALAAEVIELAVIEKEETGEEHAPKAPLLRSFL